MLRVAFVGCGSGMRRHGRNLAGMDNVEIVGHCDVEGDQAERAAREFGGMACEAYRALYETARPDAVYVAVPPYAHEAIEETAAAEGIHLFVEKPVGLCPKAAKRVAASIRKSRVLAVAGYWHRHSDVVTIARKLLRGKPISLVTGKWVGGMPEVWWWRRMDRSGGQVVEQATLLFDMVRYLCGEVAEVHAVASTGCMTRVEGYDVFDSTAVNLRLKNGATGSLACSCAATDGRRVELEVVTPELSIRLTEEGLDVSEDGKRTSYRARIDPCLEQDKAFVDAIQTGRANRIRSTYRDAVKTLALTRAVNESVASGLPTRP